MHLVPLSRNMLQRDEALVNIPGSIPAYFPSGRPDADAEGTTIWTATFTGQDYMSGKSLCLADAMPFADLRIGVVLGSGSFAKVFYGTYQGQQVAVKVSPGLIWDSLASCLQHTESCSMIKASLLGLQELSAILSTSCWTQSEAMHS